MFFPRTAGTLASVALVTGALAVPAQAAETPPPGPEPMIIGGDQARDTHGAVRLYRDGDEKCTASIIAPEWVLTAKHCVEGVDDDDADEVSFRIGNVDPDKGEEVHAKEEGIHRHDDADLALVHLERSVETDYAHLGKQPFIGGLTLRTAYIYGWGATCSFLPSFLCQSAVLKKASVVITDAKTCKDAFGGRALCATRRDGIAAKGDSGGPMFVIAMNGKPYQVGVAAQSDLTQNVTYTNVMEYQDWIEEVMDD